MSYKNLTKGEKKASGFTIIEVLIVLAIAGLILLIVFLAVPALQRNSRNTAIKNDVQNVLGGVSEFSGANNGKLPAAIVTTAADDGTVNYTATGSSTTSIKIQGGTAVSTANAAPTTPPAIGTIVVVLKAKCNGNTGITANARAVAAFYSVETSGDPAQQCVES